MRTSHCLRGINTPLHSANPYITHYFTLLFVSSSSSLFLLLLLLVSTILSFLCLELAPLLFTTLGMPCSVSNFIKISRHLWMSSIRVSNVPDIHQSLSPFSWTWFPIHLARVPQPEILLTWSVIVGSGSQFAIIFLTLCLIPPHILVLFSLESFSCNCM